MNDFQRFTRDPRAARWRRPLVYLPLAFLAAVVALGAWAAPSPLQLLGYNASPWASGGETPGASGDETPGAGGWMQELLSAGTPLSDGPVNVLILGVDERPQSEELGTRTDTIMLVRLDPEGDEIKLLSIPRDLYVEVEPGVEDRINAAYSYGGVEQTVDAVASYAGVSIDHYAVLDFEGFEAVVNEMGGVEVEVEPGEFPEKWNFEPGIDRLNGHRALFYARYRGTSGGDLDRMERQRDLAAALRSKALRWRTVKKLPAIIEIAGDHVKTDLGPQEALLMGQTLIRDGRHDRLTSSQLQGTPENLPNGMQVLIPDAEANEATLQGFRH